MARGLHRLRIYFVWGDTDDRDPKGETVFFAIVKKELRNHLASFRFWVGALLTIVLAYSSTLVAARDYNLRLSSFRERVASHLQELAAVSVYSYLQPVVVRPPEPLSVLDQGFDSRLVVRIDMDESRVEPNCTLKKRDQGADGAWRDFR